MTDHSPTDGRPFAVQGTVTDVDGVPVAGVRLRALDRDLGTAELLGEAVTDVAGHYEIGYSTAAFARADVGRADLQVVVMDPAGGDEPVARSEILFNAGPDVGVDLSLPPGYRGRSELDRYRERLEPLLDGLALAELREDSERDDLSFLSSESGIPADHLGLLVAAARAADGHDTISVDAFYGWSRAGLPTGEDVLTLPPRDLLATLKRAIGDNIIPTGVADTFDEIAAWLDEHRRSQILRRADGGPASLGDVLDLAPDGARLRPEQQRDLAALVARQPADGGQIAAGLDAIDLNAPQLTALRQAMAMRHVTRADPALMRAGVRLTPPLRDGCDALPYAGLAALTIQEWRQAAAAADPGADPSELDRRVAAVRERIADAFPEDFLLAPAARRPSVNDLIEQLNAPEPPEPLRELVGGYPGLRLAEVLDGPALTEDKAAEMDRRLALISSAYARNAAVPVLELDYLPDGDAATRLDLTGVDEADRSRVLDTLKAIRRVYEVSDNAVDSRQLLVGGYASAAQLAAEEPAALVDRTGLELAAARRVVSAATRKAAHAGMCVFAAVDATLNAEIGGGWGHRHEPKRPSTPIADYFTRIPGYAQLFGNQGYCSCRPCRSVLSPAAYFVDLMWFVQRRISGPAFTGRPADYPLRLARRRPDLWMLPLTCENTDSLVPYLDIVNEVLEGHVTAALGGVTTRDAAYRQLARTAGSVSQPFHLQLERAAAYLGHVQRTRTEVAEALGDDPLTVSRASLGVSVVEWDLLTTPRGADPAFLVRMFGPSVQGLTGTSAVDVTALLAATGWSRGSFGELLGSPQVRGTDSPVITGEKSGPASVQNDIERVRGLSYPVLDRAHRMARLARATGLSVAALDTLYAVIPVTGGPPTQTVEADRVVALDQLRRVARRLTVPIDAAVALVGPIPTTPFESTQLESTPLESTQPGLFDRLFNLEPFAAAQGRWPAGLPVSFVHPSFAPGGSSTPDNRTLQRITAGLGVSDAELVTLLRILGLASETSGPLSLTPVVLTLLFRHAMFARSLGVEVADLGRLLRLAGIGRVDVGTAGQPQWTYRVASLQDVQALLAVVDDWRLLGFTLDDADFVVTGLASRPTHLVADMVGERLTEQLGRERPWEFADTLLAAAPGLSEADSRRILAANVARLPADDPIAKPLERVPDSSLLRVRTGVDLQAAGWALTLPTGYTLPSAVTPRTLAGLIARFDPLPPIRTALAAGLGRSSAQTAQLLRLAGPTGAESQPLESNRTGIVTAAYAGNAIALATALFADRPALLRLTVLLSGPAWDAPAIQQLADDRARTPALGIVFNPTGVDLSWRAVVEARQYASLATQPLEPDGVEPVRPDRSALIRVLARADWSAGAADADLAAALGTDRARVSALRPILPLGSLVRPIRRVERVRTALRLALALGVSGETLRAVVPLVGGADLRARADAEFDALGQGADALYGVLHTTYPELDVFTEQLTPMEDLIRGRRRDALVDFLLRPADAPVTVQFAGPSEIDGYFLLDVAMGGCARTSRIVAATQSVQRYVNRVLMALESPMWDGAAPGVRETALGLVRTEWPWRAHYRLWEANRRIFLNPETYLEPELRDDRTPLFDETAEDLLQQPTDEAAITSAYSRFLQGFDSLASLRVAGTFHDTAGGADRLHILAATATDPPEYYQRTASGLWATSSPSSPSRATFSPWRRVGVQIPVSRVSPGIIGGRLYVFWLESSTRPINLMNSGTDTFKGYDHRIAARFSVARPDGSWTPPQSLSVIDAEGLPVVKIRDRLVLYIPVAGGNLNAPPSGQKRSTPEVLVRLGRTDNHPEPQDGYSLPGPVLPYVHLDILSGTVGAGGLRAEIADRQVNLDLYARQAIEPKIDPLTLVTDTVDDVICVADGTLYAHALSHDGFSIGTTGVHALATGYSQAPRESAKSWQVALAQVPARTDGVLVRRTVPVPAAGRLGFDLVLQLREQPVLVLAADGGHRLVRLGTGLGGSLSRALFERGLSGLLATGFQELSVEPTLPVNPVAGRLALPVPRPGRGQLDVDGPVGTYLRELWLELPYLLAGHLNAQQRYAAAQRWYHYLFDPTADGAAGDPDRVWRYRGFRGVTIDSLRAALTSAPALDAYRRDPFRPHPIARLRPGAYQRAVVMRYLDNLLDWGDALFAEFTRESLNEAALLYVLAADILGPRPAQVGECEAGPEPRTYATLEKHLGEKSDFLIELELLGPPTKTGATAHKTLDRYARLDAVLMAEPQSVVAQAAQVPRVRRVAGQAAAEEPRVERDPGAESASLWRTAGGTPFDGAARPVGLTTASISTTVVVGQPVGAGVSVGSGRRPIGDGTLIPFDERQPPPWWQYGDPRRELAKDPHRPPVFDLVEQVFTTAPAFCLPANRDLLAYWDRVEDRLNKIRNCMDLTGARREPSLFAPEIDPLLLARARAAGLSLEDVLAPGSGSVPPYRFGFLIERARQSAQTVQAFGAALLTGLERKDSEELNRLRATQERNLLQLRSRLAEWEVEAAQDGVAALERQRDAVEYRNGYYAQLRTASLTTTERIQQVSRHTASVAHVTASVMAFASALSSVLPNLGSPFAMTYGGVQISGGLGRAAGAISAVAAGAEAISASAGFEAGFQRRADDWAHQQQLAAFELKSLDQQIAAAQIRADMAQRALEVHEGTVEQTDEVLDLLASKFTSLGRYTAISSRLHRLYREAFSTALDLARMVERAFRFERGDDAAVALAGGYWSADDAGLGAGDALLVDLQRLEQRFLETNLRTLEVEQSFSLALLDPRQLIALQETGRCTFTLPETAFDLTYPGHYDRRIKAVRVSVPCVTGPHVSVGATLRLTRSYVRRQPRLADPLTEVPLRHTTTIATSTALADAGVFDLTFRDERYLPFEGAGAVSDWQLELPSAFRGFDYRTMSDVVLRIAYTAQEDRGLRTEIEKTVNAAAGSLRARLEADGLPVLVSCRYDTPTAWRALLEAPVGTPVTVPITARQLTGSLIDWLGTLGLPSGSTPTLTIGAASLLLLTQGPIRGLRPTATLAGRLGAGAPTALTVDSTVGPTGLYQAALPGSGTFVQPLDAVPLTLQISSPGNLALPGGATLDEARLRDIQLVLTVKASVRTTP